MSKTKSKSQRASRPFYLVQRLYLSPYAEKKGPLSTLKGKSNPFGYGRMGDYELDYMGSAEFEFGEIPKASDRLAKAGEDLVLTEFEYGGHVFDFLFIGKEGEPFEQWVDWAEGRELDEYTGKTYSTPPFDGKERPYELQQRLNGEDPWDKERGWHTAIWWALRGNVLWSFKEDGHMARWIESMGSAPTEFLR